MADVGHDAAMTNDPREQYRDVIDALVRACTDGQGQLGPRRARQGIWNPHANQHAADMADQQRYNGLLERLSNADRDVLAQMLAEAFRGGVQEALVVLHEAGLSPFEDGYEGTPFHDFVGRLEGWPWPAGNA